MKFGGALARQQRQQRQQPSLSDSGASRDTWNLGGDEPQIVGARTKNQTSVEMKPAEAPVPTGLFGKIGHGVRSLWATRMTEDAKGNSDILVKTTLRELIAYLIFLILLCVVAFGMVNSNLYYFNNMMNNVFVQNSPNGDAPAFINIASMEDWWNFMQYGSVLTYLYPAQWYNGQNITNDDVGYVLHENKVLGVARLRQLRVRNNSCSIPSDFEEYLSSCYDEYSSTAADSHAFGLKNGSAWTFQAPTRFESLGPDFSGQISSYPNSGGYMQLLPMTYPEAAATIQNLFGNLWIDRGTRAVFLDFTVYNANINLFCVVRLVAEFPSTGGVVPSYKLSTVKLIRYVTPGDYFVMTCEIFVMIFIVYYTVEEIIEIKKHRLGYFKNFWNILDVVTILMTFFCMVFDFYRTTTVNNMLDTMLQKPDDFPDFTYLSYWQMTFNTAISILVFIAWVKVFKYISFNKSMGQLSSTVGKCSKDLGGFAVMFFIFFLAFAQLGYLLFGADVQEYNSFSQAVFSLFRTILGDFDFVSLQQSNRILGPAYFILYIFFVFFILLNMFLAIINDTYSEVKSELAEQTNEVEMGDYFKKGAFRMLEKMNIKKERVADLQAAMASGDDLNPDALVDFEQFRQTMKSRGYADAEIEAVFAKYDVDGDRGLNADERRMMQADLQKAQGAVSAETALGAGDDVINTQLKSRVDNVEQTMDSLETRVTSALNRIQANERVQTKRKEELIRLLDTITEPGAVPNDQTRQQMLRLVRDELLSTYDVSGR